MNDKICREWWRNCGVEADDEIRAIDKLEDDISPLSDKTIRTRRLIGTLEMCHHKVERWVDNIIVAIGTGKTAKGLGTRISGQLHPAEIVWQNACQALSAWCAGSSSGSVKIKIADKPAKHFLSRLGRRSHLKEWQAQRVIERIAGFIGFPSSIRGSHTEYVPLVEYGTEYKSALRTDCPEYYREHSDFWKQTVQTIIQDTVDDKAAHMSLAVAIDLLMPCNWNFLSNLESVLSAIGGDLNPAIPFALCARNIKLSPIRERMAEICHALRVFIHGQKLNDRVDTDLLSKLGKPNKIKKWLAASLEKTIELQLSL